MARAPRLSQTPTCQYRRHAPPQNKIDGINLFALLSIISLLYTIPAAVFMEGGRAAMVGLWLSDSAPERLGWGLGRVFLRWPGGDGQEGMAGWSLRSLWPTPGARSGRGEGALLRRDGSADAAPSLPGPTAKPGPISRHRRLQGRRVPVGSHVAHGHCNDREDRILQAHALRWALLSPVQPGASGGGLGGKAV